ncbi:acyl CoA:acetate/3-ketoacid CoA transferase [Thauera sinica]|uniref:Acetate CoA-transferase YdiF n=1 Tax=Thauera sinica TaxID=2665146 RepID=A0ABW1AKU5_9RHOO|nr:CoA-transferase [Thauera sp. K11]ATE61564.1 acyl CoA:acetate/3-ketoacid CoA transferase [Thauera sp. K11]
MAKSKVIPASEAGKLIRDGATIYCSGVGLAGFAEEVAVSIHENFKATGHPRDMTIWHACGLGNGKDKGIYHLTHPGMIKRIVGGHFGVGGPILMKLIMDDRIEAYNLPQGVLVVLPREMAAGRPGLLSKVGLETFVDPRVEGAKVNAATTEDLVELVDFDGEQWLFYRAPRIDVALIRGTTADESGNITVEDEGIFNEAISIAQAARRNGGIVIAQVRHVVQNGTLHPKQVKVPGILVDHVVVGRPENHMQTMGTQYNRAFAGDIRVPVHSLPQLPMDERKIVARRAAVELGHGAIVNLGIGMPAGIATVAAEEGVQDLMALTLETGLIGGIPADGLDFAHATNADATIDPGYQFDYYDGGGLDVAFLGLAQTDVHGNVNVSKFSGRPVGCGGFINITQNAKKVVFCGTFTAGGLQIRAGNGELQIVTEGKNRKFLDHVEQITFSGHYAASVGQTVLYVTERAVFQLTRDHGMELLEVAPGIDIERDILAHMDFVPKMDRVKQMDPGIFDEHWGRLYGILHD